MRLWNRFAYFSHHLEVSGESILKVMPRFFRSVADGGTSGHVRRIGGVSGARGFLADLMIRG
jgi:hypothetical protein